MEQDHTSTDTCDSCTAKAQGTMFYNLGAPVMFQCRDCDPKSYERHAREDIDRWLAGGKL